MKIVFLCGSLEEGSDGVGDYTRRLSGEVTKGGHEVLIFALRDKGVSVIKFASQLAGEYKVVTVRIPSRLSNEKRFRVVQEKINEFSPHWLSLQFVPFSFDKKGIPFFLGRRLVKMTGTAKWHIMFHELWVNSKGGSFKTQILSFLQKRIVFRLIKQLRPQRITTSIPVYRALLKSNRVRILPLFSNIPFVGGYSFKHRNPGILQAVHFGSFSASLREFQGQLSFLINVSVHFNKKLILVVVGEGGSFKNQSLAIARGLGIEVTDLGKLPVEAVSHALQNADIGLSRASLSLAGKSGSTLAMLEHGLPVLLKGNKRTANNAVCNSIPMYKDQAVFSDSEFEEVNYKRKFKDGLTVTTVLFLKMLNEVN